MAGQGFYVYRLHCDTEAEWVFWNVKDGDPVPTTCPHNNTHVVSGGAIVERFNNEFAVDAEGKARVAQEVLVGISQPNFYLPNMCDPCSWYYGSLAEVNKALTDSGDGLLWTSGITNWIDLFHHRIHDEHVIEGRDNYKVKVEVSDDDGSTWTEFTEWSDCWLPATEEYDWTKIPADGYFVEYDTGQIHFGASQAGKLVRASFYKENGFKFVIAPTPGKKLKIEYAEIQGSKDMHFTCSVVFIIKGYDPTGTVPPPEKVEYRRTIYGTMWNYITESKGNYPPVPAMGGSHKWGQVLRGMINDAIVNPFPYTATEPLLSSAGMEVEVVFDEGDGPWEGEYANATFYCKSIDE